MGPSNPAETIKDHAALMEQILVKLPLKTLARLSLVSKAWNAIIYDHEFRRRRQPKVFLAQQGRPYRVQSLTCGTDGGYALQDFQVPLEPCCPIYIAGSCHGLICLWNEYQRNIVILNPGSNVHRRIEDDTNKLGQVAFGFDKLAKDYKVIKVVPATATSNRKPIHNLYNTSVKIFQLRTNMWRTIYFGDWGFKLVKEAPSYLEGKAYWKGQLMEREDLLAPTDVPYVISFDFATEGFNYIPLPSGLVGKPFALSVLGSSLCANELGEGGHGPTVWKFNESNGWAKMFTVKMNELYNKLQLHPIGLWKNEDDVLIFQAYDTILLYNIKEKTKRTMFIAEYYTKQEGWHSVLAKIQAVSYRESLVSPL